MLGEKLFCLSMSVYLQLYDTHTECGDGQDPLAEYGIIEPFAVSVTTRGFLFIVNLYANAAFLNNERNAK